MNTNEDFSDRELVARYRGGDAAAGAELVRRYHQWLRKASSRYLAPGFDFEDLLAVANVGFCEALARFDTRRNSALVTFAVHYVKRALSKFTRQACEHGLVDNSDAARWLRKHWYYGVTPEEVMAGACIKSRREASQAIVRAEASRGIDPTKIGGAQFISAYDTNLEGGSCNDVPDFRCPKVTRGPSPSHAEDCRVRRFALDVEQIKREYDAWLWPILGGKRAPLPMLDLSDERIARRVAKARKEAKHALDEKREAFLRHIRVAKARTWSIPVIPNQVVGCPRTSAPGPWTPTPEVWRAYGDGTRVRVCDWTYRFDLPATLNRNQTFPRTRQPWRVRLCHQPNTETFKCEPINLVSTSLISVSPKRRARRFGNSQPESSLPFPTSFAVDACLTLSAAE